MTENTAPIIPTTTTTANNTTMTITPPNIPPDNINNSEYQRSYSWKLPMVTIHKPKERTKSEYQREFTWKNDTPSPSPSPAPVAPSPIPQESLTACNTPEPVRQNSKTTNATTNNAIDYIGSKLTDLNITSNSNNINRHEEFTLVEKNFSTNNSAATDKWKDGLRSKNTPEPRQSTLASSLDPQTKKIVALEANRLSKKSRSYSMYSLHDQLKVAEAANDLSNPFVTEYKSEFVNWKEYGTAVREDIMANKKGQIANHTLKRRGSWSAPSLPAPLKWLEGLNLDIGPREKLKPTITDAKSIRGTNNTTDLSSLKRSNTSAEFRDYHHGEKRPTTSAGFRDSYYDEKRPTTSAGFRDSYYDEKRPTTSAGFRDSYYDEKRPTTSAGLRDSYYDEKRPTTSAGFRDSYYDEKRPTTSAGFRDSYYDEKRPTTSAGFRDHYHDEQRPTTSMDSYGYPRPMTSSELRDYRNDDYYNSKHNSNLEYSTSRKNRNSSPLRSSTTIGHYDDREHSNSNRRDYDYYDDHKYDSRKYDDRKREDVYESGYNDRRRESGYDYHDSKYSGRVLQNLDQKHYNPNHSRNHSYSSSNKGSIHDEPPSYLDATRHRSSVSSISSVSTPSSPATPNGYDISDSRWRRNNGLDPRIYKEQNYSPSIVSKSSSGSHHKYWPFEDDREKYYPSPLSPSRNKFYIDDDEEEHFGGYSSKRQSRDYKPLNSSAMRSSVISYDSRSTSPSHDGYGSSRRQMFYSSRPPSRATSISSHGTSIEEDSAILTDMLKEADMMTLKNLTDQMSVFKYRGDLGFDQKEVINSGRSTPAVTAAGKRSSLGGQKKPITTATTKTGIKAKTTTTTKAPTKTPTKAPTRTPTRTPTKTPTKTGVKTTTITTKGTKTSSTPTIPPNKKKGHRPTSSLASVSSISTTSSYREAYQDYTRPPPTNFSAAREALNRARMKVEEMLEIVSNGGSLD